jgi:polysaccharide pyruvyl transferase WcaK-like protein
MVNNWYGKEKDINVINLATNSVENVIEEIYSCDTVISSSLHGIIVAHAYNIPAVWVKFSNNLFGDGIKFYDYFESVGLNNIEYEQHFNKLEYPELLKITKSKKTLVSNIKIQEIQNNLMNVCPF